MIEINIAKDFSVATGARYYSDGKFSGEEFFDTKLLPKYEEAIGKGVKLKIILDGTDGLASSFLNEAFRKLGDKFGSESAWNNLIFVSNEVPGYINKIKEALGESKK
jgi:phosphomannomutase